MKSVAFLTLGCKVNSYETNGMEKIFSSGGYEIKNFNEKADVYIINTCSITNMADRKSRQMLHKAKKMNPQGLIVAVGCYVQAAKEEVEKDEAIDLIVGNNQKGKILELVESYFGGDSKNLGVEEMESFWDFEEMPIENTGENTRAYIKIQDGCNQFCSYCIIPYIRGRIRSRKEEDVLKEIEILVNKGYKEVVITGIHLSSYGLDLVEMEKTPLLSLLEKVNQLEGLERIRLGSLEPGIITEGFIERLLKIEKMCPHFHLSLQSGCDETLQRMNRRYTTKEYDEKCRLLRKYFEKPAITTDLIVGFPMESDEDFKKTKEFMEKIQFSEVHIFKYSKRKGTKAAQMEGQVTEIEKTKRSNELIQYGKELSSQYAASFIGKEEWVLIEEKVKIGEEYYLTGYTKRYLKLAVKQDKDFPFEEECLKNKIIKVMPEKLGGNGIVFCKMIPT